MSELRFRWSAGMALPSSSRSECLLPSLSRNSEHKNGKAMRVIRRYSLDQHTVEDGTLHLQLNKMVADLNANMEESQANQSATNANIASLQNTVKSQAAQITQLMNLVGTLGTELQPVIAKATKKKA
jgi:hypothetical protein